MSDLFIDEKGRIYKKDGDNFHRISTFTDGYYSLRAVNGVPMLEINGVRMHLIKDFKTPINYSRYVASMFKVKKGQHVLDTCGGLGYTAIAFSQKGASVTSVEVKKEVLDLARQNPYSKEYFDNPYINIVNADVYDYIQTLKTNSFDIVIHDPPTFSIAPDLYNKTFYEQVFRVLRPNGLFYHYVGNPRSRYKHNDIYTRTIEKLNEVGFVRTKVNEKAQGIICRKSGVKKIGN